MTITVSVRSPQKTAECTEFFHASVVDQCSESAKTSESDKTDDLMEHDKHCKLHVCCNSCTYFVFRASTKERSEQD